MNIKTRALKPKLKMEDLDIYLPRGIKALKKAGKNPRGLWRIFQRYEGASFFGLNEYLSALASIVGPQAARKTIVHTVPEGYRLGRHETALTLEGPAQSLIANETLLHFLSTGTRFRTLADKYPGSNFPWVFMGARYLSSEDLAIATRALVEEGILSTVPRWADKFIGTESHSQIAMWGALRLEDKVEEAIESETSNAKVSATIRATIAFHRANPQVPLYVLGDFAAREVGCFETFRATAEVCKKLGIPLVGGRMDISKRDLSDVPVVDQAIVINSKEFDRYPIFRQVDDKLIYKSNLWGMSPYVVRKTRELLEGAGLKDFKLVVSSGIKLDEIEDYQKAGADIIGIGEQAAYFLNQGQCNFTSDAVGYFDETGTLVSFSKDGRELERMVEKEILRGAQKGIKISQNLIPVSLAKYL